MRQRGVVLPRSSTGELPMRHLFVSQEFPPETGWGGIGTYVSIISEALAAEGADVHVLSVVPEQASSRKVINGVTVHRERLPQPRGSGRLPPEAWRRLWLPLIVARVIKRLDVRPQVVECPEWCAEGLMLGLNGSVPLVARMHSGARQLFPHTGQGSRLHGLDGRFAIALEEFSVRRANVVVATRSVLKEVSGTLRLDPLAAHEISYPLRPTATASGPESGGPRVTFLGRFEPRKGPDVVLRALPQVVAAVPEVRVAFVGRDATEPGSVASAGWLLAEARRLGVSNSVEVREAFGRSVVDEELARATVSVIPSRWESFGYTVAEAMARERPVVVSPIGAFQDLVTDRVSGRVVPLDDVDGWASAMIELLTTPALARAMGIAAARNVATLTEPARIAALTLEAHRHAIERWRQGKQAGLTRRARRR